MGQEYNKRDQMRHVALDFACRYHAQDGARDPAAVVHTATQFLPFLMGAPLSSTPEDIDGMEKFMAADTQPEERTYSGENVVVLPADVEAANG